MLLHVKNCSFRCPVCKERVHTVAHTTPAAMYSAPASAVHAGVGHTVVLAGTRWMVRCGDTKGLALLDPAVQLVSGELSDSLTAGDSAHGGATPTFPSEGAQKGRPRGGP